MKKNRITALLLSALLALSAVTPAVFAEDAPQESVPEAETAAPVLPATPPTGTEAETDTEAKPETETPAVSFTDIAADAPYKDAVYKLVANGVLQGYPDGTFRPEGNLTRAEMCKMINLTFGYTDTEGAAGFPDLDTAEWYMPYVLAAQKAGYVQGDDTGLFRPNDSISREEVCAILYRIVKPYDLPLPVSITDEVSDWAKNYVETIVKNSLMPLEEGNTFRATLPIRRFELAAAVAPYSVKIENVTCTLTFVDGDKTTTAEVEIGKPFGALPVPEVVPEGHQFAGWSLALDENVFVDAEFVFLESKTLYAVYEKKSYSVRFMVDNTIEVDKQTVKHGEHPTLPSHAPSQSGYTFKGWAEGSGKTIVDIAAYEVKAPVVFNAVFEKNSAGGNTGGGNSGGGNTGGGDKPDTPAETYAVTFVSEGKTVNTQKIEKGKSASVPTDPSREGYVFKHWSLTDGGAAVDVASYRITKATTFYAVFEEEAEIVVKYDVAFVSNDETVDTQVVERGKFAVAPADPERAGYVFLYWSLSEDGKEVDVSSHAVNEKTTFYAVFELDETENPNDPEVIAALESAVKQFSAISLSDKVQRKVRTIVVSTIKAVLEDAAAGELVDSDYVKSEYGDKIDEAKEIVMNEMTENQRSEFVAHVRNNVDDNTFNVLTDYFLDEETKDKYL